MVDSEQSLTGDFFTIYGYARNTAKKDYSGDYSPVMIAICMKCQEQLKSQTIPLFS